MDWEDEGLLMAKQDSMAEACEDAEGNCSKCPYKDNCNDSDYH